MMRNAVIYTGHWALSVWRSVGYHRLHM